MSNDDLDNVIHLFQAREKSDPAEGESRDDRLLGAIASWQALYQHHGETLTDPTTASSLRIAMKMLERVLNAACEAGSISEEQRNKLQTIAWVANAAADEFQG